MERLAELSRPLFGQGWRAEDDHAADLGAVLGLTGNEYCLDRLTDAEIVGDQQSDGVELERHERRDQRR